MNKKVLGLDIGSNSIGYSLLELSEKNDEIVFNELISVKSHHVVPVK